MAMPVTLPDPGAPVGAPGAPVGAPEPGSSVLASVHLFPVPNSI